MGRLRSRGERRQMRLRGEMLEQRNLLAFNLSHALYTPLGTGSQYDSNLGQTVAVSENYRAVGAPSVDVSVWENAGEAYVYDADNQLHAILKNPTPTTHDDFGEYIAAGGNFVAVGLARERIDGETIGTVYLYDMTSPTPSDPVRVITDVNGPAYEDFGRSIAISDSYIAISNYRASGASGPGTVYVYDLSTTSPEPIVTIDAFGPDGGGLFGLAMDIEGDTLAITASRSVDFFDLDGPNPATSQLRINAPDTRYQFGWSVDMSGDLVVLGAADTNLPGVIRGGKAFVYDLGSATPTQPLELQAPDPARDEEFGTSVAVSGSMVVVGTPGESSMGPNVGAAYVFDVASAAPTVPIHTLLHPELYREDAFGTAVGISGNIIVVGAPWHSYGRHAGSAHVFDLSSVDPEVAVELPLALLTKWDGFGISVDAFDDLILVGEDQDAVFLYDNLSPNPDEPILTVRHPDTTVQYPLDLFGTALALHDRHFIVGAPRTGLNNVGRAFLYDMDSVLPAQPITTLENPTPDDEDFFGESVEISDNWVVVSAPQAADAGVEGAGAVYVYDLNAPLSQPTFTLLNPAVESARFGTAVAIEDGLLIVGAPHTANGPTVAGAVYVYDLYSNTPTTPLLTLANPEPSEEDLFGESLAIEGSLLAVGAPRDDVGPTFAEAGSVFVYDLNAVNPTIPTTQLVQPGAGSYDRFGSSVSMSGHRLVVGSPRDSHLIRNPGGVYVYDLTTPSLPQIEGAIFTPVPDLVPQIPQFGYATAIAGDAIVVGAHSDYTISLGQGGVYVYNKTDATDADFTRDGQLDCDDINSLTAETAAEQHPLDFDLNSDAFVNLDDVQLWLDLAGEANLGPGHSYVFGDANLDGFTNGVDFVSWNDHKFTSNTNWCDGNFNGDMTIDGEDFVVWNAFRFQTADHGTLGDLASARISTRQQHSGDSLSHAGNGQLHAIGWPATAHTTASSLRTATTSARHRVPIDQQVQGNGLADKKSLDLEDVLSDPAGD